MNELRKATRKTIIEDITIRHVRRGELSFPPDSIIEGGAAVNEAWAIWTTFRTGLQPSKCHFGYVLTESEAIAFRENHPVGSDFSAPSFTEERSKEIVREIIKSGLSFGVAAGDEESPLAFDVLEEAGITEKNYNSLTREVVDFIGKNRIEEVKSLFGENWSVVVAFEYCWLNLPHSSPAFVAAFYQYHYYVTQDEFSAGYLWRDLEIMVHGVETEALKAIETRRRAGKSGSEKSAKARIKRRTELFKKMETVATRNPDMVKLGAETVARVALQDCIIEDAALWRQGSGQVAEYLGEIRRGEAGQAMQKQYQVLFGSKPPKRL